MSNAKKKAAKRPAAAKKAPAKKAVAKKVVAKKAAPRKIAPAKGGFDKVSFRGGQERYMFGAELVTTYVAVCRTCNENLGKATRKKAEAQEQADNHKKIYKKHKVDVISSD
jgi:hypothetical protein